jgi:hypothetical protein
MWPFLAAATVTFYLVSKAQEAGIRCMSVLNTILLSVVQRVD